MLPIVRWKIREIIRRFRAKGFEVFWEPLKYGIKEYRIEKRSISYHFGWQPKTQNITHIIKFINGKIVAKEDYEITKETIGRQFGVERLLSELG